MVTCRIGDARPDFKFTVRKDNGEVLSLASSTATTRIWKLLAAGETVSSKKIERAAVPIDLPNGRYDHYGLNADFVAGDEGRYKAWLDIVLSDGDNLQTDKYYFKLVPKDS